MKSHSTLVPHISINALYLIEGVVGGTETYLRGLLDGLSELDENFKLTCFVSTKIENPLFNDSRFKLKIIPIPNKIRSIRYLVEQLYLPYLARIEGCNILHSPGYILPFFSKLPSIVTIHDANAFRLSQHLSIIKGIILRSGIKISARFASLIITVSNYSKSDIIKFTNIEHQKIQVIYEAFQKWDLATTARLIPNPYVCAFSSSYHHKNIERLIAAFSKVADRLPDQYKLVIMGREPKHNFFYDLSIKYNISDKVIITGWIKKEEMQNWLMNAEMFCFPSLYEGFGLPLLDAQALGVPVVASNSASIPEVAGDGAIYFDPYSIEDISNKLLLVGLDQSLRQSLARKGSLNLKRFSWKVAAEAHLQLYKSLI